MHKRALTTPSIKDTVSTINPKAKSKEKISSIDLKAVTSSETKAKITPLNIEAIVKVAEKFVHQFNKLPDGPYVKLAKWATRMEFHRMNRKWIAQNANKCRTCNADILRDVENKETDESYKRRVKKTQIRGAMIPVVEKFVGYEEQGPSKKKSKDKQEKAGQEGSEIRAAVHQECDLGVDEPARPAEVKVERQGTGLSGKSGYSTGAAGKIKSAKLEYDISKFSPSSSSFPSEGAAVKRRGLSTNVKEGGVTHYEGGVAPLPRASPQVHAATSPSILNTNLHASKVFPTVSASVNDLYRVSAGSNSSRGLEGPMWKEATRYGAKQASGAVQKRVEQQMAGKINQRGR
ncbi:hypothetical protein N0V90_002624 [Kalmusia sp. IMI 367209]|nr:hypothetical protein N0V90_002624 [Kalmusia sp. IMI 367209]